MQTCFIDSKCKFLHLFYYHNVILIQEYRNIEIVIICADVNIDRYVGRSILVNR